MTTKDSRESKGGLLSVRLSVRDWLGIIGLGLTLLAAAIKVNDRLSVVETKVDLLMGIVQSNPDLAHKHAVAEDEGETFTGRLQDHSRK